MSRPVNTNVPDHASLLGMMLRLFWMFIGNMSLVSLAILIAEQRTLPYHLTHLLFLLNAVLLILARYLDIAYFKGDTAQGEPATMKDWRHYALKVAIVSLALWAVANGMPHL